MNLIVVGAGDIGARFTSLAVKAGHDVTVIEEDEDIAEELARNVDARVLQADISAAGILDEAGAGSADALIATTYKDPVNLMAMVLGREHEVRHLVTLVNEREHAKLFDHLGVTVLEDPSMIVSRHLYRLLDSGGLERVVTLSEGADVIDVHVQEGSELDGATIEEATAADVLPSRVLVLVPDGAEGSWKLGRGNTKLEARAHLLVLCPADEDARALRDRLAGTPDD